MLLLLGACSDQDITGKNPFAEADPLDSGEDSAADTAGSTEECNGVDDDGDGEVDEGYPDADGNGRVDCLDNECPALDVPTGSRQRRWLDDVYEGRSGALVLTDTGRSSYTLADHPAPVDLDHDGHTELLVVSSGETGWGALTILEHDGAGWAGNGRAWPIHDYGGANVAEDGSVPSSPWADPGLVWTVPSAVRSGVDQGVAFTDWCVADCTYGPVVVGLQVWNAGAVEAPAGGELRLYAGSTLVMEVDLPAVPAQASLDAVEYELTGADVASEGWTATVSAADGTVECDDADNTARGGEGICG